MNGEKMKQQVASKLLSKLGNLDPSNIEAITLQLVMKGAPMEMKEEKEPMGEEHSEGPEEEESPEEAYTDTPETQKKEYGKAMPKQKGKYCPDCGMSVGECECE